MTAAAEMDAEKPMYGRLATGSTLPMYFYLQACVELSVTLTLLE